MNDRGRPAGARTTLAVPGSAATDLPVPGRSDWADKIQARQEQRHRRPRVLSDKIERGSRERYPNSIRTARRQDPQARGLGRRA